jgi:adenosylcobinamide-phosphate guanylyltransferase
MHALILAGGGGTRLDLGEKSLVTIQGKPMIGYVVDAFRAAGHEGIVVLTEKTPYTRNWCRARGVAQITASGSGYIEDIREAAEILELMNPFFTCGADLPCLRPNVIREIEEKYRESGKEACSVWVPRAMVLHAGCRSSYIETISGVPACPAGINILRGDLIAGQQEEFQLLLHEESLVFNINTREELERLRVRISPGGRPKNNEKPSVFSDSPAHRRNNISDHH